MLLHALLLAACSAPSSDDTAAATYVDERMTAADYADAPPDALVLTGPDEIVEPGQDVMWCISGTYTGPDIGITELRTYQGEYGHHVQLYGTSLTTLDQPDGMVWDCTSSNDFPMDDLQPIAFTTHTNRSDVGVTIPEGFGVKLKSGQRWVLQSHYVNSGTVPLRFQDVATISGIEPEAVQTWAAPFYVNHSGFDIPPHQASHSDYDITTTQDLNFLVLLGHEHEWGTQFAFQQVVDGAATDIYRVETWQAAYRDSAPMNTYAPGEFFLPAGSVLRNSCDWYNDTDEPLDFPAEMCVTAGLVYPFTAAVSYSD